MAKKIKAPGGAPSKTSGDGAEALDGAAPPKKKSKKKLFLMAMVVVLAGGGAYAYMGMGKKPVASATGGPPTSVPGTLLEEGALTVNLRGDHYLEFTAALQVAAGQTTKVLVADQAVVLDILNTQAAAMTQSQLNAPGGELKLKTAILAALGQEWPGLVTAVYFEQFVMQ